MLPVLANLLVIHSRWPVRRFYGERSLIVANEPAAIQAVDVVFFRFSKEEEEKDYRRRRWKDFERLEWIRFWKFLKKIRTLERDGSKILKS